MELTRNMYPEALFSQISCSNYAEFSDFACVGVNSTAIIPKFDNLEIGNRIEFTAMKVNLLHTVLFKCQRRLFSQY